MAQTRATSDKDDNDSTTTNDTASNDNKDEGEPTLEIDKEKEKSGSGDEKNSSSGTTDNYDDASSTHSTVTNKTTYTIATVSSMITSKRSKKMARLAKYREAEKRRQLRMKIKTKVYKEISPDMNVFDSEAESTDAELQDTDLNQYRTNTLKCKYKGQAKMKHNNEMKQHSIQQKGFTAKLFEGTQTGLETLMVELETAAST